MDDRKVRLNLSDRTHSKRGKTSIIMGIASLTLLGFAIYTAIIEQGNAGEQIGMFAIVAFMLSTGGLMLAIKGKQDEDVYNFYPVIGIVINAIITIILLCLFLMGL